MPAVPYVDPERMSKTPLPQESLLLILGAPFASCFGVLGVLILSGGVPSLLLLRSTQDSPALALLRAYQSGILLTCVLAVLAPFVYVALDVLLFRVWGRRLGTATALVSIPAFTILSLIVLVLVAVCAWAVLGAAKLPMYYGQYSAEIQQLQAGEAEHVTVLLDERSIPNHMPGGSEDDLVLHCRNAFGADTQFQWVTLRFPDGLDFTPDPEGFVVIGQTYEWNWENQQRYEVFYTSELHLVEKIVPVP